MVIDENGNFMTQRKIPKMALIKPKITNDYIILTADVQLDCLVPIKPTNLLIKCRYLYILYYYFIKKILNDRKIIEYGIQKLMLIDMEVKLVNGTLNSFFLLFLKIFNLN